MNIYLKYVIVEHYGNEIPLIFSNLLNHNHSVNLIDEVVSAGFCLLVNDKECLSVQCWGKSTQLGVESRGDEDAKIIEKEIVRFMN